MLRGFVLFGDDFTYVRVVAIIAFPRHPCLTLAAKLRIPSAIGMVFATHPTPKQMGQFLSMQKG